MATNESWLPVPERLVRAIETAPRADKRAWAIASLVVWVLAFYRLRRGEECSLRDLRAWSCSNSQSRAKAGKADAQQFLDGWTGSRPPVDHSQTTRRPPVDHPWTSGVEVQAAKPESSGPPVDHRQTTRRPPVDHSQTDRARSSSLQSTTTGTNTKRRRKSRSSALSEKEISAVTIPAGLASLDGFTESWLGWTRVRGGTPWKEPAQVARILAKLDKWHAEGLPVLAAVEKAYESSWSGFLRRYLEDIKSKQTKLSASSMPIPEITNNSDPFDQWVGDKTNGH